MTPTLTVLRIDGHGAEHLSLHTKPEQARARLVEVAGQVWAERFGYKLPGSPLDPRSDLDAGYACDRLVAEGWRVRIDEVEVEL